MNDKKNSDFPIPDIITIESAKKIFLFCDGNYYKIREFLGDRYEEFRSVTDKDRLQEKWASEECERVLKKISHGDISDYGGDFRYIGTLAEHWISNGELLHPALLTDAWKKIIVNSKDIARIGASEKYLSRFSVADTESKRKILPLLDMFKNYMKFLTKDQLWAIGLYGGRDEFQNLCKTLRRQVNENSTIENNSFHFTRTSDAYLDIIADSLMKKWNSTDTVKELTSSMNCLFGVENERYYLSGVSSATLNGDPRSFDIMEFVAVCKNEKQAYLFRCRLNADGKYNITEYDSEIKSLIPIFEEAVEMYRNRIEWKKFTEEQGLSHWFNEFEDRRTEYLSRFPKVYRDVYARIPDCSIKDTLIYMVDTAEETCGEYGGSPEYFSPPATDEEIAEWESSHNISIPDDYKEFLKFANGVTMPDSSEFFGLSSLGSCIKYLKDEEWDNYCDAGSFIGDGTMLCFDDNGDFYEWQDGEMSCLGSFNDAVRRICDLSM